MRVLELVEGLICRTGLLIGGLVIKKQWGSVP
jgi:hypothetical protein